MATDKISKSERSAIMAKIKSRDTTPEMTVRRLVHSFGFRYRLHQKDLPGKPDLVFRSRKKVIFVHGCFWHGHSCTSGSNQPSSNIEYWKNKLYRNKAKDKKDIKALKQMGWEVLVLWECEIKNTTLLLKKLKSFLN